LIKHSDKKTKNRVFELLKHQKSDLTKAEEREILWGGLNKRRPRGKEEENSKGNKDRGICPHPPQALSQKPTREKLCVNTHEK